VPRRMPGQERRQSPCRNDIGQRPASRSLSRPGISPRNVTERTGDGPRDAERSPGRLSG